MITNPTPTNKRVAIRQARKAVTMYRQGSGWIVSTWDEEVGRNRLSSEMTHPEARQVTTTRRLVVAVRALGGDVYAADLLEGQGSLEDRLAAWIEEHA